MSILVTGGAGYVGLHCVIALAQAGHRATVLDNFCNADPLDLKRVASHFPGLVDIVRADIRDPHGVTAALRDHACRAVIHLAGLKSVPQAERQPGLYHANNVEGTSVLLGAMEECGTGRLVYSSSSTVYGMPEQLPVDEDHPLRPAGVYGATKAKAERLIASQCVKDTRLGAIALRYFNPAGASSLGLAGETASASSTNLFPNLARAALGELRAFTLNGTDHDTPDGSCIRDYVHVEDLAHAHLLALDVLDQPGFAAVNLGSGKGISVLQVASEYRRQSGCDFTVEKAPRRLGDVSAYHADTRLARSLLGWQAKRDLQAMCRDDWHWQTSRRRLNCSAV